MAKKWYIRNPSILFQYNWQRAPNWYKEALERFLVEEKGISPDKVKEWARTKTAGHVGQDL